MSIAETNTIDMIASRPDTKLVKLIIADHLPWDATDYHAQLLQDKINTYITFVESGQMSRITEPKIPLEPEVQIVVALQHEPNQEGRKFLDQVAEFLHDVKLKFHWEVAKN